MRHSAAILDCPLDARCAFLQAFKVHSGMERDIAVEGQKLRLRRGGDLKLSFGSKKMNPVLLSLSLPK